MIADFKFVPLRMNTPHDNLRSAIGIIQSHILAEDSSGSSEVLFGPSHFKTSNLEAAVALLVAMLGEAEDMRWPHPPDTP